MCSGTSTPHSCRCHAAEGIQWRRTGSLESASAQGLLTSGTGWKRVRPGEAEALRRAGGSSLQGGSPSRDGMKRFGCSDGAPNVGRREGKNTRLRKSWLRTHRMRVGAGVALPSAQRGRKGKREAVVLVRGRLRYSALCGKRF